MLQVLVASLFGAAAWLTSGPGKALTVGACAYLACWAVQFVFNAFYLYSRHNDRLLGPHTISISTEGFGVESVFGRSLYYWHGIVKVVERVGYLAVYVTPHSAYIVPTRAFAKVSERDSFRVELLRYFKERRASVGV
jgi:hypothetical protein